MKKLTEKQLKFVELVGEGTQGVDAVMTAYNCKSRASARCMLSGLLKNKTISEELTIRKDLLRKRSVNKQMKFIDILKELAPPLKVAQRLAELIFESDKRTSAQAIESYLRLSNEYPDAKIGLYRDFEKERELILSPAELPRLLVEQNEEEARSKLLDSLPIEGLSSSS